MPTVLHLIESWGPGGAETVFLEVARGLRERGWTCLTAVPREGWLSRTLRENGFAPTFTGGDRGWDVRHLAELLAIVRRNDVELVQTHLFGSALYGGTAAKIARIPAVATFHGLWDVRQTSGYRRVKVPLVDWACDRKVFVSEPLRRTCVEEIGMGRDDSVVIENGIDTGRFRPGRDDRLRRELGIGEGDFFVGAVGNVRPAKNHGLLLRVARRLKEKGGRVHVALVGEGEGQLLARLERQREELGLGDAVHFTGFRDDVDRIMRSLDAYVLTSDSEGFSLTTVQAMACGLPVVATRCGGPESLIEDGATGFLVEPDDAAGMAEVLCRLQADEELRARVGEAASAEVRQRYSLDRMVDGYERLYRELLGSHDDVARRRAR